MSLGQLAGLTWNRVQNLATHLRSAPPPQVEPMAPQATKDWAVLVYMEGRQGLAHSTELGLNQLEQIGSTDKIHVAVQAHPMPIWQERILPNMGSLPTRRYHIQQDQDPNRVSSPVVADMPGKTLNSQNLADFGVWGVEKFPSQKVMLVIKKPEPGAEIISDQAPFSARQTEAALADIQLRTGKKIDVLAFDSCNAQQLEVAYQLRKQARVMTGSEEDVQPGNYPYSDIVKNLDLQPQLQAPEAGRMVVSTYAETIKEGMQSATDLSKLEQVAASVRRFVDEVQKGQISRAQLYTSMLNTRPMERAQPLDLQHNYRDIGSFFQKVADDPDYPPALREAARQAGSALENSILRQFASPDKKKLKEPTGLSAFLPWRALSPQMREAYNQLDWAKDSGWGQLLDYIFDPTQAPAHAPTHSPSQAPTASAPPVTLGLSQRLGKWGLYQYKKYVSPYLNVTCAYTPSCSQFARQAIEQYGLWEGGKIGVLRFFSCNGLSHGHDPLKGSQHVCGSDCQEHHQNPALAKTLIEPMQQATSPEQFARHRRWIGLAQKTGLLAGGIGLAALAIPLGAAVGAWTGYQAGRGKLQDKIDQMAEKYNPSVVRGYLNIAEPLGAPGARVHDKLKGHSKGLARVLGGITGALVGLGMGAVGAAVQGVRWGKTFGQLWAGNRAAEALGHLPPHPETQAILRQDYHSLDSDYGKTDPNHRPFKE